MVSIIIRVAAAIYLGNEVVELPGTYDQISYHQLALRVASGDGFSFGQDWWPLTRANEPTAHWSYLYTLYLVLVYKILGPNPLAARLLQAVLVGFLQPIIAFQIGKVVFNRSAGLISAVLTAGYAYFIYYAATLMTEPFFISAVMASLYLVIRIGNSRKEVDEWVRKYRNYIVLGVTLGLAVLLRQVFLLVVPFLFLYIFWLKKKESVFGIALVTLVIIMMILPLTIFNFDRFDQFVLLNTNAGYAFFWANHPIYGTKFQPILSPDLES
jgi:4-amino-4-deoxy-L-arabinose transferase-like glycosyltransferase